MPGYDYTQPGAYFVTICTQGRAALLGDLDSRSVTLSPIGQIIEHCWLALPRHFPHIVLDALVIMPDHLHGIITITASTAEAPAPVERTSANGTQADSLAAIMQNFKSVSTRRVNQMRHTAGAALWQRNYYERVIRTDTELARVRQYIADNPARASARASQP